MLIIKANVFLYGELVNATSLMSGVRCSLKIEETPHICQIETFDGSDIPLNIDISVKLTTISGEISLLSFKDGARFTLFRGKEIGVGKVEEIKEVHLEKRVLEVIKEKRKIKSIISYAEQLPCALIYDDVYELIG